jgi:hypothetical protein
VKKHCLNSNSYFQTNKTTRSKQERQHVLSSVLMKYYPHKSKWSCVCA